MSDEPDESCAELSTRRNIILRSPESEPGPTEVILRQADTDEQLVELWLHGRPDHTQRAYRKEADRFRSLVTLPLREVKLADIHSFADQLKGTLQPPSIHRSISAVKSLFSFGFRLGYLQFNVGQAVKLQGFRDTLSERIITETEILRIISMEPQPRNRAILLTLYAGGFRVSEICSLKWRHLQERDLSGQITVFGKRGKTRTVLMPQAVWETLQRLDQNQSAEAPVFRSRKKGHLDESAVWRVVAKAASRAGIAKEVSCHWFRHAHASHSLDRGAPIHLVQATLGHASIATTGRYLHARPTDSSGNYLRF